ncbi:hypothetical protein TNCV_343511 [Trichonephila clavipes]|nr:hypothetical protein TNCV_343511 [Trichonephila clavipes]
MVHLPYLWYINCDEDRSEENEVSLKSNNVARKTSPYVSDAFTVTNVEMNEVHVRQSLGYCRHSIDQNQYPFI